MRDVHHHLLAAAAIALTTAGCSTEGEPAESAARASSSPATEAVETAEPEPTTPLEGVWRLEQTKGDVVAHLHRFGFGDLVDRFVRVENVTPQDRWEWTFTGDDFVATWQNPDGSWRVADSGTFEVDGKRAILDFAGDAEGHTTTFHWRVEGDRLWLAWKSQSGGKLKGIPDEAFWRAYLTKPLTRAQ